MRKGLTNCQVCIQAQTVRSAQNIINYRRSGASISGTTPVFLYVRKFALGYVCDKRERIDNYLAIILLLLIP